MEYNVYLRQKLIIPNKTSHRHCILRVGIVDDNILHHPVLVRPPIHQHSNVPSYTDRSRSRFDSFQPAGTLSAITSQAVGRLLGAGFLPFLILQDITNLGPKWGLGVFGFLSLAMWPIPFLLFFFGTEWRAKSKYSMVKQ